MDSAGVVLVGIGYGKPNSGDDIPKLLVAKGQFPKPEGVKAEATRGLGNPLFSNPELPPTPRASLFGTDQFEILLSSLFDLWGPIMRVDVIDTVANGFIGRVGVVFSLKLNALTMSSKVVSRVVVFSPKW